MYSGCCRGAFHTSGPGKTEAESACKFPFILYDALTPPKCRRNQRNDVCEQVCSVIVKVLSSAVVGIDSFPVDVEVDISRGLPQFSTVGLPDTAVKESRDRIKAAMKNSGYPFPENRVTVNLAPADIRKEGTGFDLPIALGILAAEGLVERDRLRDFLVTGELSLDGRVKGVQGVLPSAFMARAQKLGGLIVPAENAGEAALVQGLEVIPVGFLSDLVDFLNGAKEIPAVTGGAEAACGSARAYPVDFSEIQGQQQARRAMEVAAAGGHNILLTGPRGRQDDARPADPDDPARAFLRGGPGDDEDLLRGGSAGPARGDRGDEALPGAAPHGLRRGARGAGTRRSQARSVSRTTACSSSTSCPSSSATSSRFSGSPWKTGR